MKYYAGIGSRETPDDVLVLISKYARFWAEEGWILRSGGADGADLAFEQSVYYAEGQAEIFLPWPSFNYEKRLFEPCLVEPKKWAYDIAELYHPSWKYLKHAARKLIARNTHQIVGPKIGTPAVSFVCCWTKDGKGGGGTGQAIRIAKAMNIPVLDLGDPDTKSAFEYAWKRDRF